MQLIMGGINGDYLTNITLNAAAETQEVLAAVAYATDMDLLFDWCWNNGIPLKYYGRLDEGVRSNLPSCPRSYPASRPVSNAASFSITMRR